MAYFDVGVIKGINGHVVFGIALLLTVVCLIFSSKSHLLPMIADPIGQLWIPLDKLDTTTTRFSYPTNPDYSQYLQYSKSLLQGNSRRGHEEQSPALDYRIVALTHPGVGLTITIREYAALQPSRQFSWGGSSFLVASGLSGVGCPTRDHFNGTYTAVCPPGPNRTACSRVTVTRAGRDYDLYRLKLNPTSVRVYTGHHCWSNADPTRSRARTVATWSGDSVQVASITHRYGVPIDLTRADVEICHRLRAFDHVSMMGVSHMRYAFDYVMLRCFGTEDAKWLSRKHGDCHVGNVDYKIVYYATDWRAAVRREMTEYRLTSGSLVIVQFGAYDLMTRDYRITMTESVAQFMRSVRRLCSLGARVVVVATPPFPDKIADRKRRGHRNNFAVSAFNYNVWKRIVALQKTKANLHYFDMFNAILPWQNHDTVCGGHYMCRIPHKGIVGNIGIQVFKLMMATVLT